MLHSALQDLRFAARGLFQASRVHAVPAMLALVALVASLVPALRASRVDPLAALRHQ